LELIESWNESWNAGRSKTDSDKASNDSRMAVYSVMLTG
jgi:hypothetical protein